MKKTFIYLLTLLFVMWNCQSKTDDNPKNKTKTKVMVEKFDFELFKKYQNSDGILELSNGKTIISMAAPDKNETGVMEELLPNSPFLYYYKEFYPNGNLKKIETKISETVKVDQSVYYKEDGTVDKTVDENRNYGNIKYGKLLAFLDEKGYIDLKNGKGRLNDDGTNKYDIFYDSDIPAWNITITQGKKLTEAEFLEMTKTSPGEPSIWKPIQYIMDANTGKLINEK